MWRTLYDVHCSFPVSSLILSFAMIAMAHGVYTIGIYIYIYMSGITKITLSVSIDRMRLCMHTHARTYQRMIPAIITECLHFARSLTLNPIGFSMRVYTH